jgi:hypothetical protein
MAKQKSAQRYSICGDNSGHDYFIPVEQVDEFYKWAEAGEDEESYIDLSKYDDNRIDGKFTFTDPRCE